MYDKEHEDLALSEKPTLKDIRLTMHELVFGEGYAAIGPDRPTRNIRGRSNYGVEARIENGGRDLDCSEDSVLVPDSGGPGVQPEAREVEQ